MAHSEADLTDGKGRYLSNGTERLGSRSNADSEFIAEEERTDVSTFRPGFLRSAI